MLETLRKAFKIEDIRKRIFYTFLMLIVIRIGSQLPLPGVNGEVIANWFASQGADGLNFFNAITGGSFEQMSVFALNITPYITSSIIMQLLTIAIPKLEEMQKDGEDGRKKIAEITRYVTVILALIQATAMAIGFGRSNYLDKFDALHVIMMVTSLTAGSAVLMWIGERITEKGVGNGISIVLTINIVSRIPEDLMTLYNQFIKNAPNVGNAIIAALVILAVILVTVVFVIILQDGQRKIPVQYSKKIQGRKQVGGQSQPYSFESKYGGRYSDYLCPVYYAIPSGYRNHHGKRKWQRHWKQNTSWPVPVLLVRSGTAHLQYRPGGIYYFGSCICIFLYLHHL